MKENFEYLLVKLFFIYLILMCVEGGVGDLHICQSITHPIFFKSEEHLKQVLFHGHIRYFQEIQPTEIMFI